MCLDTLDVGINKGTGVGYKVFSVGESYHLYFPYYGGRIKTDFWYKDKAKGQIGSNLSIRCYPTGYHIFLTLEGAKAWAIGRCEKIRRVEYRML